MTKAIKPLPLKQLKTPLEALIILLVVAWGHAVGDETFTIKVSRTASIMFIVTLASSAITLWYGVHTFQVFQKHRHQATWQSSLKNLFWLALLGGTGSVLFLVFSAGNGDAASQARAVETVIPLVIGAQMAFAFSPNDEPALETTIAYPRPVAWMLLERFVLTLLLQTIIALIGVVLSFALVGDQDILIALVRWFPPAIFFSGLGVYVTLKSRSPAFGVVIVGIVWGIFYFFPEQLLPGIQFPKPLNYVHPFLWSIAAYLQPDDFAEASYYWLNRALLLSLGFNFIVLTVRALRDEEQLLLGS